MLSTELINRTKAVLNGVSQSVSDKELDALFAFANNEDSSKVHTTVVVPKVNNPNWVLRQISRIYHNSPFFDLLILGSYADNTYTMASDIDDIVIVKRTAFTSASTFKKVCKQLNKLARFYQQIDPVQHHAHWIFMEWEFNDYNQSVMPLVIFDDACAIAKELKIDIAINNNESKNGFSKILDIQLRQIDNWQALLYKNQLNIFYLKEFISSISLVIPLFYQEKKKIQSKKNAIESAHEYLDERAMLVLGWTSLLRQEWQELPKIKWYYFIFRIVSLFMRNRSELELLAKRKSPAFAPHQIPGLSQLRQEDFRYFISYIQKNRNVIS